MEAPTHEEIAEKLVQLKQFSRAFDAYRACMRSTSGEQVDVAYQAMLEAEKKYLALSDWFIDQGIAIRWHKEQQKYVVLPSIHTPATS